MGHGASSGAGTGAEPATTGCFHGGASFERIGVHFDQVERRHDVVDADVLDAWFDPAPGALEVLREHLAWSLRRSPPTDCEGLLAAIARSRRVPIDCLVPGAGSSDLIFRAFREWIGPTSRVVLPQPTYGEYAHVLERVIGARVTPLHLRREDDYDLDLERLHDLVADGPDWVVLVNPNSPTGRHAAPAAIRELIESAPSTTRFWIDETYVEYVGSEQSLERYAAASENTVMVKSMSKVYALSGVRAAYVSAPASLAAELRRWTPPWSVSLPAQLAAVRALDDPAYYTARYQETHARRAELAAELDALGLDVVEGVANFLLAHLPESAPTAAELSELCRERGVELRDASDMGETLGPRAIRIAVKSAPDQARLLTELRSILS